MVKAGQIVLWCGMECEVLSVDSRGGKILIRLDTGWSCWVVLNEVRVK